MFQQITWTARNTKHSTTHHLSVVFGGTMVWIWLKSIIAVALFTASLIWLPLYLFYVISFGVLLYIHRLEKELKNKKNFQHYRE